LWQAGFGDFGGRKWKKGNGKNDPEVSVSWRSPKEEEKKTDGTATLLNLCSRSAFFSLGINTITRKFYLQVKKMENQDVIQKFLRARLCPLPRSDRILGCMLPICHPIGGCLLHRQFSKAGQQFYPAPRFQVPYRTPLPRTSPFQ
jgi:hypothetical protein